MSHGFTDGTLPFVKFKGEVLGGILEQRMRGSSLLSAGEGLSAAYEWQGSTSGSTRTLRLPRMSGRWAVVPWQRTPAACSGGGCGPPASWPGLARRRSARERGEVGRAGGGGCMASRRSEVEERRWPSSSSRRHPWWPLPEARAQHHREREGEWRCQ